MSVTPGPMGPLGREYAEAQRAVSAWVDKQATRLVTDIVKGLLQPAGAKGETTGVKVEGVGVAAGVKVVGAEKTLFDLTKLAEEARLHSKGQMPDQLQLSIKELKNTLDRTRATVGRNLRTVGGLSREVRRVAMAARNAGTDAFKARDIALRAQALARTALDRQRAAAARPPGRGAQQQQVDSDNIRAAADAIRRLEERVDQLVRAL